MTKKNFPEFHKALMEQSTYPSAPRRIKFEETLHSLIYRTGDHTYKIRKTDPTYSSLAIKERYAVEAQSLLRRWAPGVTAEVVTVEKTGQGYALGGEGEPVEYALCLKQLSDHYWLDRLIDQGKVTPTAIGRLARFLADHHREGALEEKAAHSGRPEHFQALIEEIFYQAKKYFNQTLTETLMETVSLPMLRFPEEFRRQFSRRQKKGHVVDGHGAFLPGHIYMKGSEVMAISPLEAHEKFRLLDAANDVATLVNELLLLKADDLAEHFVHRYIAAAKDRDLMKFLPAYQTLQAMRCGLVFSERMAELSPDDPVRSQAVSRAEAYFNLAVRTAREIPRPD